MNAASTTAAATATTPLRRFAYATTTTCATQASVYGKCIVAHYKDDVRQGTCKEEFEKFGRCLREAMKRKW